MEIHLHESLKVSPSARWLGERYEDIRVTRSTLRQPCANLALRSAVGVLVTQPLEDPLGGVTLFLRHALVVFEDLIDHSEMGSEFGYTYPIKP